MRLSLKELREQREQGRIAGGGRRPFGIPVEVELVATGPIAQPVSLAEALTRFGLDLSDAHEVLNQLVTGKRVSVTLHLLKGGEVPFALCRFGLSIGQSIKNNTEVFTTRNISSAMQAAIESWRLSRPDQPPIEVAVQLMVREYLKEHGLIFEREDAQEAKIYQTE